MNPVSPAFIIADAHDIYANGLSGLLKDHFTGCTTTMFADAADLLHAIQQQPYDILFIEAALPPVDGFHAAQHVLQLNAGSRIIMYADVKNQDAVAAAFTGGANAFFYTNENGAGIIFKVSEMLKHGCCITEDNIKAFRAAQQRIQERKNDAMPFSKREQEVLEYIIKGFTNRQIAQLLFLAESTVSNHRFNIMRKTGCHNAAQLAAYCRLMGWL